MRTKAGVNLLELTEKQKSDLIEELTGIRKGPGFVEENMPKIASIFIEVIRAEEPFKYETARKRVVDAIEKIPNAKDREVLFAMYALNSEYKDCKGVTARRKLCAEKLKLKTRRIYDYEDSAVEQLVVQLLKEDYSKPLIDELEKNPKKQKKDKTIPDINFAQDNAVNDKKTTSSEFEDASVRGIEPTSEIIKPIHQAMAYDMVPWMATRGAVPWAISKKHKLKEVGFFEFNQQENPLFFDRGYLDEIKRKFDTKHNYIQTIHGAPGFGKSQTAKAYAIKYRDYYNDNERWIDASKEESLRHGFDLFYTIFDKNPTPKSSDEKIEIIKRQLNEIDKWLLVFDNVEDFDVVKRFLPITSKNKHVLITAIGEGDQNFAKTTINKYDANQAVAFLKKRVANQDIANNAEMSRLAMRLDYHPLALEQAAAYIIDSHSFDSNFFVDNYISLLDKEFDIWKSSEGMIDYKKSFVETTSLSLKRIGLKCEEAKQLVDLLAYFSPDNISLDLFQNAFSCLHDPLKTGLSSLYKRNRMLKMLTKDSSILEKNESGYSIHRLTQECIRKLHCDELIAQSSFDIINYNKIDYDESVSDETIKNKFVIWSEHARSVINNMPAKLKSQNDNKIKKMFSTIERGLVVLKNDEKLLEFYNSELQAVRHADTINESIKMTKVFKLKKKIADIYYRKKEYNEAIVHYMGARESINGLSKHPNLHNLTILQRMAECYNAIDLKIEAASCYIKGIQHIQNKGRNNEIKHAVLYWNLSSMFLEWGDFEYAAILLCRYIKLNRDKREYRTTAYTHMGGCLFCLGLLHDALNFYQTALDLRIRDLGETEYFTLFARVRVAETLVYLGDKKSASEHIKLVVENYSKNPSLLDDGDKNTQLNSMIGDIYRLLDNYEMASKYLKNVYGNKVSKDDVSSENFWEIFRWGNLHLAKGDHEYALSFYTDALNIADTIYGKNHFFYAAINDRLGQTYILQNRNEEALDQFFSAQKIYEKATVKEDPDRKLLYENISKTYLKLQNFAEAEKYEKLSKASQFQDEKRLKQLEKARLSPYIKKIYSSCEKIGVIRSRIMIKRLKPTQNNRAFDAFWDALVTNFEGNMEGEF